MNIHLILVGDTKEPLVATFSLYGSIDKVYLLHTEKSKTVAKEIDQEIKPLAIKEIFYRKVEQYDMNSVVNAITDIAKSESENSLFINITGGTKLMSGAATAASFFVGAQAYYVITPKDLPPNSPVMNRLVELPVPNIPYHNSLTGTQLDILRLISRRTGKVSNKMIKEALGLSAQTLSYHIRQLDKKKLVMLFEDEGDSRMKYLSITNPGKLVVSWSKS
jgi:CRISPR locus-related DNA-binding protein